MEEEETTEPKEQAVRWEKSRRMWHHRSQTGALVRKAGPAGRFRLGSED